MGKRAAILLGFMVLSGVPATFAQQAMAPAEMSGKSEALIQRLVKADQFSGTVLVARDGVPVFRKAYGFANREWKIPNVAEAKFRVGSITKQFTATAILQLAEAGKLSIDDPISKYYSEAPATWNAITIRHLLTHTSGIPSYTGIPHFFDSDARLDRKPEDIIKLTRDKPLEFAPGSKFSYDNSGYIILGYIVEKLSGEPYADYIQHHIFDALGMKSSGYDVSETIIPDRAAGYDWNKTLFVNAPYLSMTEPFSAGSLYSTVDDMLIWDRALDAGKPLSAASLQAMFTDYGHGYGFGWFIDKQFGHEHIYHSGGINGFVSRFDRYPGDKLTIVVLSNESNAPVGRIADGLAAFYLGIPPRSPAPGGDAMLSHMIDELRQGTPDYSQMSSEMAELTRAQLPGLQARIAGLGPVQSISLIAADPGGMDRYKVIFQNDATEWGIRLGPDGKMDGAGFRPLDR